MAYRELLRHRKNVRLARLLGIDPCFSAGILDSLWWLASRQKVPNGDLSSLSALDISDEIDYSGDPDALMRALIAVKFVDEGQHGVRWYVHDYHDWAPDFVHMRLVRSRQRFGNGAIPSLTKFKEADREKILAEYEAHPAGAHGVRTTSAGVRTDAHGGALKENEKGKEKENEKQRGEEANAVREFWEASSRHPDPLYVAVCHAAFKVGRFREVVPPGAHTVEAVLASAKGDAPNDAAVLAQIALFEAYWLGQEKITGKGLWWAHLATWFDNCRKDWLAGYGRAEKSDAQIVAESRRRSEALQGNGARPGVLGPEDYP